MNLNKTLMLLTSVVFMMAGCSSYYRDAITAPTEQELEDVRAGRDFAPRSSLRHGVFHMQRVQVGSTVRVNDQVILKKPDLPPFDIAYISRDLESIVLELANAAGESVVIPQGLRGRKVTLVHSGANFQKMLDLVLGKAGYHYNYVDGVWYITRYPTRSYVLEVGQATRKGSLIAKTELAAETTNTNTSGSEINTDYSDTLWSQIKETLTELVEIGKTDLGSPSIAVSSEGISGRGEIITAEGEIATASGDILEPPRLDSEDEEEEVFSVLTAENGVRPFQMDQLKSTDHLVPEEAADTWFKITESVGLLTVRAAPEAHRLIEDYLEQVQTSAHRQVMIEARIVALIRDKSTNHGFQVSGMFDKDSVLSGSLGFIPASELDATNLSGGFLNLTASPNGTKDLTAIIQSLSTLGDVYTLSSPSLLARNNQMSRVSVTKQLGYVETEVETATGSTGEVSIGARTDHAEFKNAGTVMSVIPFIGKNKVQLSFRLSVATKSSETKVNTSIGDAAPVENVVPNLANNIIDQDMVLEYGRVYAIGGLIETSTTVNESYEPTLSQLPGLKEVFRRANNQREDTEFIVLIRVSRG